MTPGVMAIAVCITANKTGFLNSQESIIIKIGDITEGYVVPVHDIQT